MKNLTKKILVFIGILMLSFNYSHAKTFEYKLNKFQKNTHKYLGLTVLGLTALGIYGGLKSENDPSNFDKSKHGTLGKALAISSGISALMATCAYKEDLFDFSDGFTKKHLHALIGGIATGLFIYTANSAGTDTHKTSAILAGSFAITAFSVTLF